MKAVSAFLFISTIFLFLLPVMAQSNTPQLSTTSAAQVEQAPNQITAYQLPPDKLAKATALYKTRLGLALFNLVFGFALLILLLKLRVAPKFREIAEGVSRFSFVQAAVFVPLLLLTMAVISLPIEMFQHHISVSYGLSVQKWGSWFADVAKGELISWIVSIVAVWALFWTIRKSPRRWWFYFWLESLPFIALMVFVAPLILDPMFHKFEPLEKAQPLLVSEIEKVTHRGGLNIPRSKMFEMKASEKVTTYNAYVTGIGPSKRVVVWDTTAKELPTPETLFIFGHEQGHYVLNHIYKGLAFACLLSLIGLWIGSKLISGVLARWGEGWGIRSLSDYAALPAMMLVLAVLTFGGTPIGSTFSRYMEHQADVYGLEVTHGLIANNGEVAASSFQKLGEKSYSYPTPSRLYVFWSYDHPPISDRVKFCLSYDPWHGNREPEFVR